MTNLEANKAIARRWLDLVSEHAVDEICAMTDPAWTMHGGPPGRVLRGTDGLRELFDIMGRIEQRWTIDDVIAEGDRVVVRATNRCMQEVFFGIPSYGRPQTFTATFTFRIAGGKVLETWRNADDLGRVLQLGARIQPAPMPE